MNPNSIEAYNFILKFKSKLKMFEGYITFKPKYKFQNLSKGVSDIQESFFRNHCFSKGQYCHLDPERGNTVSVLNEALR